MNTSRLDFHQMYKLTTGSNLKLEKLIATKRPRLFNVPTIHLLVNPSFDLL